MLLAVDTSTQWMGLALYDGEHVLGEMAWQTHSHHSMELAPAVVGLLERCGVAPAALTVLAIARGPGSFTSLRIGMAFVKGMSLSLHIPVVSLPTLDYLAAAQPLSDLPMAAVLQAGRGRLAVGMYAVKGAHWVSLGDVTTMTFEEFENSIQKPTLVCGEFCAELRHDLSRRRKLVSLASPAQSLRNPAFLAELAWQRWKAGHLDEVVSLAPIYLHMISTPVQAG